MEFLDKSLSRFPLSEFELRCLLIWDEGNRALAVLDRMIETFDCTKTEMFYPGEALRWMLQTENAHTQRQLYRTVAEGISALTPPYSDPYVRAAVPYCETCPNADLVVSVVDAVTKSVHQLRDTGGEAHIEFFTALPTLSNESIEQQDPDLFYDHAVYKSRVYAVPLLLYDDDIVRKSTASHLSDLFSKPDDVASDETVRHKYQSMRRLVKDLSARIIHEHDNQSSRSYMQPLISTCTMLVKALYQMTSSEDPALRTYQQSTVDLALIQTYQNEVEPRLEQWTQEIDTPLSTGGEFTHGQESDGSTWDSITDDSTENYEQSDYGSESDEGQELEG
jgi:ubiquitin carboxyl-terminal hydrolase 34